VKHDKENSYSKKSSVLPSMSRAFRLAWTSHKIKKSKTKAVYFRPRILTRASQALHDRATSCTSEYTSSLSLRTLERETVVPHTKRYIHVQFLLRDSDRPCTRRKIHIHVHTLLSSVNNISSNLSLPSNHIHVNNSMFVLESQLSLVEPRVRPVLETRQDW
jgi:hypothetical protein